MEIPFGGLRTLGPLKIGEGLGPELADALVFAPAQRNKTEAGEAGGLTTTVGLGGGGKPPKCLRGEGALCLGSGGAGTPTDGRARKDTLWRITVPARTGSEGKGLGRGCGIEMLP